MDDVAPGKIEIRPEYNRIDLLKLGVLYREEGKFHSIKEKIFEQAVNRYHQELLKYYQEERRKRMQKIDQDIAKYKEMERDGDFRAKVKCERLQELKNVMISLSKYTDFLENNKENKEKQD